MYLLKHAKNRPVRKGLWLALGLMLVLVGSTSLALGQEASASQVNQELNMTDLLKLPGKVLGEGRNTKVTGKFKVARYRVEEVTLPQAVEKEIRGEKRLVGKAFRVTVVGGPFPVRAMPPVVWIGDVAVGYGVENEDLNEITAITYDPDLLLDGATLYLSYGDKKNKEDRVEVPEKLKLAGPKGGVQ